ncbi:hypothetical protein KG088_17100 [Halomonas sp. TRM85114]|uniref:hypothetical protein n=1 Tax=Halomonas jincaotanensis TaxID=2810616 RepID=UPI001BD3A7CE|nr:hypothetical protein [Halomonas jincaotanensis]MBS9405334.1 hypothetical protein [Halomonas jincaotanensis]
MSATMAKSTLKRCLSLAHALPWMRIEMAALMLLGLFMMAAQTSAHHVTSILQGGVETGQHINAPQDAPSCHHGHGMRHLAVALPRVTQQDIKFATVHESLGGMDPAPWIITSIGVQQALPDPSPIPVYLLTQRFRS